MSADVIGTCDCGIRLIAHRTWEKLNAEERAEFRRTGHNRADRVGECHACGCSRRWQAYRDANPLPFNRRADVLAEWEFLVDHRMTMNANIREIAPRLGMTRKALAKALGRAGVRSWPTDTLGWAERGREERAS